MQQEKNDWKQDEKKKKMRDKEEKRKQNEWTKM